MRPEADHHELHRLRGILRARVGGCALTAFAATLACAKAQSPAAPSSASPNATMSPTFADDVAFLRRHGKGADFLVLESKAGARVLVSPKYQARVMTSAVAADAPSLGWVNRAFIEGGKTGTAFDNYGGEDRFWLGPEGGQFALYFAQGKPFVFSEWQTPHALQEGAWSVTESSKTSVTMTRAMVVTNASGATFELAVTRVVRVIEGADANAWTRGAKSVAFETVSTITNTGARAWTKETGLLSIWILGMFAPASDARIVIPYRPDAPDAASGASQSPIVNDRYFGKIPADRLEIREADACVVFTADGHARGKIGLTPSRATGTLASYSAKTKLLTVVTVTEPDASKGYVDNMWEKQTNPFAGDALNAYNDGPTEPGKPSLGGFYELESSSPAAALLPHESITHTHRTSHVVVDDRVRAALDAGAAMPLSSRCLY
jgi:hypothetical protein